MTLTGTASTARAGLRVVAPRGEAAPAAGSTFDPNPTAHLAGVEGALHARTHTHGRSGHRRPCVGSHRRAGRGRSRLDLGWLADASAAVTGRSIPATASTGVCSSPVHLEALRRHGLRVACRPRHRGSRSPWRSASAGQGWGAWPACSAKLHLSGTVSGAAAAPRSAHKASRSAHKASGRPARSRSAHKASRSAHKASWSAHETSRSTTRHPLHTGGRHVAERPAGGYVVRAGDCLSSIAARHRLAGGWQALYALNRSVVGKNPNLILVGQHLRLR